VLRSDTSANPEFVERFRREARAAAALNHPNIVAVYDWGDVPLPHAESSHLYFIVMEYVPGANLKEVLAQGGPLPEGEALSIAAQAAAALHAAHQQGVVHRDVKPHNILLTADGRAKMTDFGIAFAPGATQLTSTNIILGTVHYLSPEQAQGKKVDARSDVYSLGAVLYELLTGQELFAGSSSLEVALQHVNSPAPSPRSLRRDISSATEAIVRRALTKNPSKRYQSAEDMRLALEEAQGRLRRKAATASTDLLPLVTESVPRTLVGPRSTVDNTTHRNPAAWLLAVPLLIILMVAGATVFLTRSSGLLGSAKPHAIGRIAKTAAPATPVLAHRGQGQPHRAKPKLRPAHVPKPGPIHKARSVPTHRTNPTRAPASNPVPVRTAPTSPSPPAVASVPTPGPAPTAVIAAAAQSGAATPTAAVESFYAFIANHQFDDAARVWSQNMVNTWGIQDGIVRRFSSTTALEIKDIRPVSQSDGHAAVVVDLLEWKGSSPRGQELIGTWDLIQGPSGWLLDQAHF
jgi:serine/threonine protein kinase